MSWAIVDVANFYVSAERLFDPGLHGVPVIVLSNNDGCAVARSEEAKALHVRMGEPVFSCATGSGGMASSSGRVITSCTRP